MPAIPSHSRPRSLQARTTQHPYFPDQPSPRDPATATPTHPSRLLDSIYPLTPLSIRPKATRYPLASQHCDRNPNQQFCSSPFREALHSLSHTDASPSHCSVDMDGMYMRVRQKRRGTQTGGGLANKKVHESWTLPGCRSEHASIHATSHTSTRRRKSSAACTSTSSRRAPQRARSAAPRSSRASTRAWA